MTQEVAVYDKAKYHIEGNLPRGVSDRQAYLHPGMFFGWLVEQDLVNDEIKDQFCRELGDFQAGGTSPADLFALVGGVLAEDMLNEEGNRFAADYYDRYLRDYQQTLGRGLTTPYHVEDTRENYETMKGRIEAAFKKWKTSPRSASCRAV